ncbi:MAG: hypothetical protein AAGA02_04965 [Bacteroidota bacterium]
MVPRIKKNIDDLNTYRQSAIRNSLNPITETDIRKLHLKNISTSRNFVIGVSTKPELGTNYTGWRFKTKLSEFEAMYYERWILFEKNVYFLDRIYFHLYEIDSLNLESKEFVLLHCDSALPDDADHAIYKQSPHLHFYCAPQPIPHSHIALNNYDLEKVFHSLDNLDEAFKRSIQMIDDQILSLIKVGHKS